MIPRDPTEEDIAFWGSEYRIIKMQGDHLGAGNLKVLRGPHNVIKVAWVIDERDSIDGLREGITVWTTFWGGMLPTDVVLT